MLYTLDEKLKERVSMKNKTKKQVVYIAIRPNNQSSCLIVNSSLLCYDTW